MKDLFHKNISYFPQRIILENMEQKNKNPNCRQCIFSYVTWDNHKPHGCRAFGFKSKRMPSIEVFEASGKHCLKFVEKNHVKNKSVE